MSGTSILMDTEIIVSSLSGQASRSGGTLEGDVADEVPLGMIEP
jgi:hypothetical protein